MVHGVADRLMTACNAELTATTRNDGGGGCMLNEPARGLVGCRDGAGKDPWLG